METPSTLLYHIILPAPANADAFERTLFLSPERFATQMNDLHRRGFRTMTLGEFGDALVCGRSPERRVLLTFDNAYAHVDETVTPILTRLGFSAVMFAPWQHLSGLNCWDAHKPNLARLRLASRQQLSRMATSSWEIASHGLRHVDLTKLQESQIFRELVESREALEQLLGHPVRDLAYPFGATDDRVRRAAVAAGYERAFLAHPSVEGDRLSIGRRLVRGDEGMLIFRLKTSSFSGYAARLGRVAPAWVKSAGRRTLTGAPR